jgi:hypothetical protein
MLWTKIDTTLEPKLRSEYNYSPPIVALFYTLQFVGYLAVSPFCHVFLKKFDGTLITCISFCMIGISCFLIGPSYLMRSILPDKIGIMIPGLLITGLFTSFTTIGTYQEMQLPFLELHGGAEEDGKSDDEILYDKDKLGDILAGLYNGGYSLGVIIGPFSASYLQIWLQGSFNK